MTVDRMRTEISKVYSGQWINRVNRMSDSQVMAVYYSFLEKGKFDELKRRERAEGKQLSMF